MRNIKETLSVSRDDMINRVSIQTGQKKEIVQDVFDSLEEIIYSLIQRTTDTTNVYIRLFRGLTIKSEYRPEKKKINNLTGDTITVHEGIKPKATFTQWYRDSLSSYKE